MNRLRRLIHEVHRRSLWQVVAIYLGASWLVIQVVALVSSHLALPNWVTPAAILLLLIGLPIVIATAFIEEGLPSRRAPVSDRDTPGGLDPAPATTSDPPPTHERLFTWRNAIAGGVVAFALLGIVAAGYVGVRALVGERTHALDARAVAILPFRVTGDPSLDWMREGVVDLLAVKLGGADGSRAADARATLVQWRRVAGGSAEPTVEHARAVARRLGAGRFILGDAVRAGPDVVLSARLVETATGRVLHTARREGSPDGALGLLDRVIAELLVREAGEDLTRIETLTSTSLPAVQAYLAGLPAYRRSRFSEAALRFREALEHDSTFTLAAFYMARAYSWIGYGPEYDRGMRLAWEGRDRLSERDRRHVIAAASSGYPAPRPARERLQAYQDLLDIAPDDVEAWYGYADVLYHDGYAAGIRDAHERARTGFERALAIDSTFATALNHLIELAAFEGDTASVRRLAARYDPAAPAEVANLPWILAVALGDSAALRAAYAGADTSRVSAILLMTRQAQLHAFGLSTVPALLDIAVRRSVTQAEQLDAGYGRADADLNAGRPTAALRRLDDLEQLNPNGNVDFGRLIIALSGRVPRDIGVEAAARLAEQLRAGRHRGPLEPINTSCVLTVWTAASGDIPAAQAYARRVAARPVGEFEPLMEQMYGLCEVWGAAAIALASRSPDVKQRLTVVDDWLLENYAFRGPRGEVTVWLARAWEDVDEPARALATLRRAYDSVEHLVPRLLLEARLALRLGDRDSAVRAYRHFLALFADPEPGWAAGMRQDVQASLTRLVEG
jgi:tetratricopeptide (TPR) repeat protein